MSIDPVILKLQADVAKYNRDVADAARHTDTKLGLIEARGKAMGNNLSKGFSLAKTAAISFAASLGVDAVVGAITRGLEYASSLGEVATQLGVTTNALQEYRYAASQSGVSTEEMDQALSQLTRRIGEAESGTKAQAKAFETLGIKIRDANGHVITAGDALPQIAEAMKSIESPAERAALLMDLFGRSGQKLEPLLAGGAAGVNALRDAAHKLGIVLSDEQIQNADDTADKLGAIKQVLEAKIAGTVADNADSILALADAFGTLVTEIGGAVKAYKAWRIESSIKLAENTRDGWFTSAADKADAQRRINGLIVEQNNLGGNDTLRMPKFNSGGTTFKGNGTGKMTPLSGTFPGSKPVVPGLRKSNFAGDGFLTDKLNPGNFEGSVGSVTDLMALADPAALKSIAGEMQKLAADLATARAELSGDLREQAAAQKMQIDARLAAEIEMVAQDDDLKGAKGELIIAKHREIALAQKQLVDQNLAADIAKQKADADAKSLRIREDIADLEADALEAEAEITLSNKERLEIEHRILDAQQGIERAKLEQEIAAWDAVDAEKARTALLRKQSAERTSLSRDGAGPGGRYLADLKRDAANITEAIDQVAVDGLDRLNDGLVDAIMGAKSLGEVFKNVANQIIADLLRIAIQQAVIQPLAEALFGGGGGSSGGGGLLGGLFGGIFGGGGAMSFGRASGGPVSAGQMYRVNEAGAPGRVEGFIPQGSGTIVPLGRMNAMTGGGQGGGTAVVRVELSGDIDARIQQVSGDVAVQVVRASAPSIIDASARETMARAGRPRL